MSSFELQEFRDSSLEDRERMVKMLLDQYTDLVQRQKDVKTDPPQSPRSSAAQDVVWRSKCCNSKDGTEISRSCMTYALTSTISLIVLIFAMYQLAFDSEEDSLTPLWISLVSSIGSLHLPSPLQMDPNKK